MSGWELAATVPPLAAGECQVWWARRADARAWHPQLLDGSERGRLARLRRPVDQDRFMLAASLLRIVLGAHLHEPPAAVEVIRTCPDCAQPHGKPRVARPGWECSVSHSGDRVAVAISRLGPVGVDVEEVAERATLDSLIDRVLASSEALEVRKLPACQQHRAFLTYWTRKEAVLKATGEGLRGGLTRIVVSAPHQPPRLLAAQGRPELVARAALCSLHAGDGYEAALAVLGRPLVSVRELSASIVLSAPAPGVVPR